MVSIEAKPVSGVVSAKPPCDLRGFWFRGWRRTPRFGASGRDSWPLPAEPGGRTQEGQAVENPTPRHRSIPPRRPLRDRLTPYRLRVWYGPNTGGEYLGGGPYAWHCPRCERRGGDHASFGGDAPTLDVARFQADWHARGRHWLMRAVYEES